MYQGFDFSFKCQNFDCRALLQLDSALPSRASFPVIICPECDRLLELHVGRSGGGGGIFRYESFNFQVRTIEDSSLAKIPEEILRTIKEAIRCFTSNSYYGTVAMCRRIVEGIVVSKGAGGRNLKEKIDNLGNRKLISERVAMHDHYVRSLGNIACHFDSIREQEITRDDALVCVSTAYEVTKEVFLEIENAVDVLQSYGIESFVDNRAKRVKN